MRRLTVLLITLAAGLGSAGAASACSCLRQPSAEAQLRGADAAFTGVVEYTERGRDGRAVTRLRVADTIKGRVGSTVAVEHRTDGAACGVVFRPGERRLVLASRDERGGLTTNLCTMPQFSEAEFRRAAQDRPPVAHPPGHGGSPPWVGHPPAPRPPVSGPPISGPPIGHPPVWGPPGRPPVARCDADRARFAVGRRYSPRLGEQARERAGAATLRVRRPGEMYTQEFRADRLNLDVSRRGVVRGAACG